MIEFSGTNRSHCYVRYINQDEAREAIKRLNSYQIRPGYPLAVTRSVDNRKLCVKAMPPLDRETEEDVVQELGNVVECVELSTRSCSRPGGGWRQSSGPTGW